VLKEFPGMITSPAVAHIFKTMRSTSFVIRIFFAEWVRPDFSAVEDEVGCSLLTTGVLGELVRADADGGEG
jgi:hypothetical protein